MKSSTSLQSAVVIRVKQYVVCLNYIPEDQPFRLFTCVNHSSGIL